MQRKLHYCFGIGIGFILWKRKNSLWLLQIWEFHRVILFGFNRPREKKMKLVEEGTGDCLWGFPRELDSVVSSCKQPLVIIKCKHKLINTNLKLGRWVLALASYFETLPKAQRTRGLSSSCQSNFLKSYQKFKHKSWSHFIFRISTKHQQKISTKHQHLHKT